MIRKKRKLVRILEFANVSSLFLRQQPKLLWLRFYDSWAEERRLRQGFVSSKGKTFLFSRLGTAFATANDISGCFPWHFFKRFRGPTPKIHERATTRHIPYDNYAMFQKAQSTSMLLEVVFGCCANTSQRRLAPSHFTFLNRAPSFPCLSLPLLRHAYEQVWLQGEVKWRSLRVFETAEFCVGVGILKRRLRRRWGLLRGKRTTDKAGKWRCGVGLVSRRVCGGYRWWWCCFGKRRGGRGAEEVCRLRFAIRASASNEATFSSRRVRSAASEEAGAEWMLF